MARKKAEDDVGFSKEEKKSVEEAQERKAASRAVAGKFPAYYIPTEKQAKAAQAELKKEEREARKAAKEAGKGGEEPDSGDENQGTEPNQEPTPGEPNVVEGTEPQSPQA